MVITMQFNKDNLSITFNNIDEVKQLIDDEYRANEGCSIIGVRARLVGELERLL